MGLSTYIKTHRPGWDVTSVSALIGKPTRTLYQWWIHNPELIACIVRGLP